jgi:hypothetical protein
MIYIYISFCVYLIYYNYFKRKEQFMDTITFTFFLFRLLEVHFYCYYQSHRIIKLNQKD